MKVVIVEDEELAAEGLTLALQRLEAKVEVVAVLDSVRAAVAWFNNNPKPDLAFFDIQLADGLSFAIFEQCNISCPVIFTTAYDEYALRAFKVNSIDYLLKPFEATDLQKALEKWRLLRGESNPELPPNAELMRLLMQQMTQQIRQEPYKSRFMVKIGDNLLSVNSQDIDYLYSENKIVWLRHQNGRKYLIDYTLEQLEELLDPALFYRINRKYIIAISAIKSVAAYTNSRLKVFLKDPPDKEDILISRERVESFKGWMGK